MAQYEIKDGVGIIPEGTTELEYKDWNGAFEDCIELTSIIIPNSVMVIGNNAFKGCTGLTSIVLPEKLTEICK